MYKAVLYRCTVKYITVHYSAEQNRKRSVMNNIAEQLTHYKPSCFCAVRFNNFAQEILLKTPKLPLKRMKRFQQLEIKGK